MIAQDTKRLGKTLRTTKVMGERVGVVGFRDAEAEAHGIVAEIGRRHLEGAAWQDMAILYRSNALSRGFEEALMRSKVPYVLVGMSGSISAPRSRMPWRCCGWRPTRTTGRPTRRSAGCATPRPEG